MTATATARRQRHFRIVCRFDISERDAFDDMVEAVTTTAYAGREIVHLTSVFTDREVVFYAAVTAFDPLAGQRRALAVVRDALRSASIGLRESSHLSDVRIEPVLEHAAV